ncbi:MAG: DUF4446 family protein [Candidatus Blackburnbacteria bacterium]|nr:DUF4446 family protein [Candidatus Blackburnbacteria bacterium]
MLLAPSVLALVGVGVIVWVVVITVWLCRVHFHYKRLIGATNKTDLKLILEDLINKVDLATSEAQRIQKELSQMSAKMGSCLQKVGVIRFNPYSDTGGNQSFALACLNEADSGLVILSLHGREGTRVYIKGVNRGKSTSGLSREEKQAIEEAR